MKIASQLYNLARSPLSFQSKLEVIKTLGYDGVELAGFNGRDYEGIGPADFRKLLDKLELEVTGVHLQYGRLADSMERVIYSEIARVGSALAWHLPSHAVFS